MDNSNLQIQYTRFLSLKETRNNVHCITTWGEFVKELSSFAIAETEQEKQEMSLFNGTLWVDDRRVKLNAILTYLLVIDVDGGMTVEQAVYNYQQLEFCLYSSFNHLYDKKGNGVIVDKFRIVFPLAIPITYNTWQQVQDNLQVFCPQADRQGDRITQTFTLPVKRQGSDHVFIHNKGRLLDMTQWPKKHVDHKPIITKTAVKRKDVDTTSQKLELNSRLYSKEIEHFSPRDIPANTLVSQVECPFHADKNPGEFFVRVNEQYGMLKCAHCGVFGVDYQPFVMPVNHTPKSLAARQLMIDNQIKMLTARSAFSAPALLLYTREGYGKSTRSVDTLLKMGRRVIFCCKSNMQAEEKGNSFRQRYGDKNVQICTSQKHQLKTQYDVEPVIHSTGSVWFQSEEMAELPTKIAIAGKHGRDRADQIYEDTKPESPNFQVPIICTTWARLKAWQMFRKIDIPSNTVIYFDDPGFNDMVIGDQNGEPEDEQRDVNGTRWYIKPEQYRIGYGLQNPIIYTTTEVLTAELIKANCKHQQKPVTVSADDNDTVFEPENLIFVITPLTRSNTDGLIPLINKMIAPKAGTLNYIADGQGQLFNHTNSKGQNTFIGENLVIEVSHLRPHTTTKIYEQLFLAGSPMAPIERNKRSDASRTKQGKRVEAQVYLDMLHQAAGRDTGYRQIDAQQSTHNNLLIFDDKQTYTLVLMTERMHNTIIRGSKYRPQLTVDLTKAVPVVDGWVGEYLAMLAAPQTIIDDPAFDLAFKSVDWRGAEGERVKQAVHTMATELQTAVQEHWSVVKDTNVVTDQLIETVHLLQMWRELDK